MPAIHKLRGDVAELFAQHMGSDPKNDDPHYLNSVMREDMPSPRTEFTTDVPPDENIVRFSKSIVIPLVGNALLGVFPSLNESDTVDPWFPSSVTYENSPVDPLNAKTVEDVAGVHVNSPVAESTVYVYSSPPNEIYWSVDLYSLLPLAS